MEEGILGLYKEIIADLKKASKRNFIIILVLLLMLFGSNMAWLIYEAQYETVADETEQYIIQEQEDTENSNMSGVIN